MAKLLPSDIRQIIQEEITLLSEATSLSPDSVDSQIDSILMSYETDSVQQQIESRTLRGIMGFLFEAPEDEETAEDIPAEPTPEDDPDALDDKEVDEMIDKLKAMGYEIRKTVDNASVKIHEPGQEARPPINIDEFVEKVVRLKENYSNLLDIPTVIQSRAKTFLMDRYDKDSADEFDEKIEELSRDPGEMRDMPERPIAVGAGASKLA